MKKTLMICGYGPGIAHAVACRFGKSGYSVAIIARDASRLAEGVNLLNKEGINVQSFVADLGDLGSTRRAIVSVRKEMGPIGILHWNAYSNLEGDLISVQSTDLIQSLNVRVVGYIDAVQNCLSDLKANHGAVLATSGVMAFYGSHIDSFAKDYSILAISVAAQHKATSILNQTLISHDIYVGEVVVNGFVKSSDSRSEHNAVLEPSDIADAFWELYVTRKTHSIVIGASLSVSEKFSL